MEDITVTMIINYSLAGSLFSWLTLPLKFPESFLLSASWVSEAEETARPRSKSSIRRNNIYRIINPIRSDHSLNSRIMISVIINGNKKDSYTF